jgi:hypothetical protein
MRTMQQIAEQLKAAGDTEAYNAMQYYIGLVEDLRDLSQAVLDQVTYQVAPYRPTHSTQGEDPIPSLPDFMPVCPVTGVPLNYGQLAALAAQPDHTV